MGKIIEGKLEAGKHRFGLIVSRFNDLISKGLLSGAEDCLKRHGADDKSIDVIWVPGAFEIPLIAKKLAETKKYDAIICLGAVIRGATSHYELVAAQCAKGIAKVSLDTNIPVVFGVVTADTLEQALERAGAKPGNKGFAAAMTAIELANLADQI